MKHLVLLSSLIITFHILAAQPNLDSLRQQVREGKTYAAKINASIAFLQHFALKNFDTVIIEGNHAIELARQHGDSVNVAEALRFIGVAHYFKGNYDQAAQQFHVAIALLEKSTAKQKLAAAYNDLAKLYRKTRDLDRALANYNRAETLFRQLKDSSGIAMILNESGVVFEYRKDYKEALRRYTASMNMAALLSDSLSISYSLSNIAGVYVIQENYDEAEKNHLKALEIRRSLKDGFGTALTYSDLGATLNAKGDYIKAINYLHESNKIAKELNYPELQSNNYNELASIAQKQGDYQNALFYFQQRTALRDSLFAIEKTKQIEEINARYETVKREQMIDQQQHRLRFQNYLFVGIAGLVLLAGLLIHSQHKRNKLRQETRMKTELMTQQDLSAKAVMEAEENERQRIAKDLHDGVGQMMSAAKMNLSAFEAEIPFKNTDQRRSFDKIIELVDESCREVRNVSHIMMPNALHKNNLAAAIQDFTQKLNTGKLKIHLYTEGLDKRLDTNTEIVLYRVLQECVNNVIRHSGASNLDISLVRDKDGISGTVEDNGKGFDSADKNKFNGMGLRNIITRIEYLKGTVDFDSAPGRGTVVAFFVPVA